MIEINNIKLNTSVHELGLSAKLLNRLKMSQVNTFKQMMELDTSKWENVVAAKVISAMRNAQTKYKEQYEELLKQQKATEEKKQTPQSEVSSDPQLEGEAYSRMTNTSFAVPSTYDQRRFFVANNILNAYILSGRLQDEEGPLPLVMREIVKVADSFMDAFDGKPYVEEEEEEEEIIVPIPVQVTPQPSSKPEQKQKQPQPQKSSNPQKQNNSQKKDKSQKQEQKPEPQKQEQPREESQKRELQKEESLREGQPKEETQNEEIHTQETPQEYLEDIVFEEQSQTPVVVMDVVEDPEGVYVPISQEVIEIPDSAYLDIEPEEVPYEVVQVEELAPVQVQEQTKVEESKPFSDEQHPEAERGQNIRIVNYLGRGKRGSKYFQPGDLLTVKRMRKGDDGVIVVSATIKDKNVCFDSKHYTWALDQE